MSAQNTTGFIVKATCDGHPNIQTMGLREGYDELIMDCAEAFDLIPASITIFSMHNGTKFMVHLGAQGDLDVVLAESMEWGSHVISLHVSGIAARRALDGVGALASVVATVSQILYLRWMLTQEEVGFMKELYMWTIILATILINLGNFAYLFDDEADKNHPFRERTRMRSPTPTRMPCPLTSRRALRGTAQRSAAHPLASLDAAHALLPSKTSRLTTLPLLSSPLHRPVGAASVETHFNARALALYRRCLAPRWLQGVWYGRTHPCINTRWCRQVGSHHDGPAGRHDPLAHAGDTHRRGCPATRRRASDVLCSDWRRRHRQLAAPPFALCARLLRSRVQ